MSKISNDAAKALINGESFRRSNTVVEYDTIRDEWRLYLHGNCIAKRGGGRSTVYLSHCGWETVTTKSRLNAILDLLNKPRIVQRDFVWYWGSNDIEPNVHKFNDGWNDCTSNW